MKQKLFLLSILLLSLAKAKAQDVHFSQFYETAILRNPSLIGIYSEDFKISGQTRNQWTNIGRGFRTGQLSAEMRLPIGRQGIDFISFGLLGYSDKAGTIAFNTVGIYPAINYNKGLDDDNNTYLSVGFTGGHITRSLDVNRMTFDNQYQNGAYSPINGTGEQQMPNPKLSHWDIGAGVSMNSSPSQNMSYYMGLGAYHFTKPNRSFFDGKDIPLAVRWSANAGFSWFINDTYSLILHGNYQRQGSYQEVIGGGFLKWSNSYGNTRGFGIYGGVFYRLKDAVVPTIKIDYKGQSFSFSYDVNTSSFKDVTRMRGGFEVAISYSGFLDAGPEDKRSCPRF